MEITQSGERKSGAPKRKRKKRARRWLRRAEAVASVNAAVRLTPSEYLFWRQCARDLNLSFAAFVRRALEWYVALGK